MTNQREHEPGLMGRQEILEIAGTEAGHKGNESELQHVNNILVRGQIHQQLQLEDQMDDLESSIDSFKNWSRGLMAVLIILSAALLLVELTIII